MSVGVQVPNGAAGFYLLGRICRLTNRHKVAQSYHKAALTLDPLLWSAYEELCMLGIFCKKNSSFHLNRACMQTLRDVTHGHAEVRKVPATSC